MLETFLRNRLDEKEILLMTHIVLGYPSFDDSYRIIETMVAAGVDLMELQIPFSEPTADGPVIVQANLQRVVRMYLHIGLRHLLMQFVRASRHSARVPVKHQPARRQDERVVRVW